MAATGVPLPPTTITEAPEQALDPLRFRTAQPRSPKDAMAFSLAAQALNARGQQAPNPIITHRHEEQQVRPRGMLAGRAAPVHDATLPDVFFKGIGTGILGSADRGIPSS